MTVDTRHETGAGQAPDHEPPGGHHSAVVRFSLRLVEFSMREPRRVLVIVGAITVVMLAMFVRVSVDTDPENMLPADADVRVLNAEIRERFGTGDMIAVGIFSDTPLTDAESLAAAAALHDGLLATDGVDGATLISPRSAIVGDVPTDDTAVAAVFDRIDADALLGGNVVSADRDTFAFFVPLDSGSDAQRVRDAANELLDADPTLGTLERHIAGLPLAQEAFGDQMFVQMAVFAPMAGVAIFALMLLFFRRLVLVLPAMALAMLAVIWTMGALIGTGNTLHIMSSMIPIFLMPIAILDAVHVISEFFDRYSELRDRKQALRSVYAELAGPIAFTSITTVVGFGALALTPIPPVRVFGIFVATGVVFAWLGALTVLPALLTRASTDKIDRAVGSGDAHDGRFAAVVRALPIGAVRFRTPVLIGFAGLAIGSVPLIAGIEVNDNPVNWFRPGHEVRVATERMNAELSGTFGANIVIERTGTATLGDEAVADAVGDIQAALAANTHVGATASYLDLDGIDSLAGDAAAVADALAAMRAQSPLVGTLVTDGFDAANIRILMTDGDNQAMQDVVDAVTPTFAGLPDGVTATWGGETYLNLVWQDEMVAGMLVGFVVTLACVAALLAGLFRSVRWALIGILPVLWTILVVYGTIGLIGKDYDMPIAVLSTLILGIGVDFAIHFVQRFRDLRAQVDSNRAAIHAFAEEPARALTRNAAVVAVGFLPLLLSSLTPYVIVGLFLASLITLSWLATVVALPALVGSGTDDAGGTGAPT